MRNPFHIHHWDYENLGEAHRYEIHSNTFTGKVYFEGEVYYDVIKKTCNKCGKQVREYHFKRREKQ